jgi:hypothetical protein
MRCTTCFGTPPATAQASSREGVRAPSRWPRLGCRVTRTFRPAAECRCEECQRRNRGRPWADAATTGCQLRRCVHGSGQNECSWAQTAVMRCMSMNVDDRTPFRCVHRGFGRREVVEPQLTETGVGRLCASIGPRPCDAVVLDVAPDSRRVEDECGMAVAPVAKCVLGRHGFARVPRREPLDHSGLPVSSAPKLVGSGSTQKDRRAVAMHESRRPSGTPIRNGTGSLESLACACC